MNRLVFAAALLTSAIASHSVAATALYTVTGDGEARVNSFTRIYLSDGSTSDTVSNVLVGTGGFTATYTINLDNLPVNAISLGYLSSYQSLGTPNFITSISTATFGGEDFGLTTTGNNYSLIADGVDFENADIIVATGLLHGTEINEFFAGGALKSRTTIDQYNQLYANSGGSNAVGGVSLPGLASASQQIIFSKSTTSYNEDGSLASFKNENRFFLGNGDVIFRVVSGAVPESSTWLMMIAGFGMVGGALRRQRKIFRQLVRTVSATEFAR